MKSRGSRVRQLFLVLRQDICRRAAEMMRGENGQALVITALCLTFLMGAMALGVDVGYLHYQQRQLQTAADSAAIAAGLELGNCGNTVCTNMKTAAEQALVEDGITSAISNITETQNSSTAASSCSAPSAPSSGIAMEINDAPCLVSSDPNNGNKYMTEVVLVEKQNTFFGAILGKSTVTIEARAEAGDSYIKTAGGGGNCIWTGSITFNSSDGNFNLTSCGIYDNGGLTTNNGDTVTATDFLYYGAWSPNNCNSSCVWNIGGTDTGSPTHTTTQQPDPLASLTAPSQPAASTTASDTTPNNGDTLKPGYYSSGINLNSNVTVNLTPGLYYMNGSINVNSGATLECTTCTGTGTSGVTLYFTSGSLQPNSGSTVTLSAPASALSNCASCANMLIWTSSTNGSGLILDAGSASYYNGIIYLPDGQLTLNSGSGATINGLASSTAVDAQSLMVDSGITFDLNGSQSLLGGSASQTLGSFALAE